MWKHIASNGLSLLIVGCLAFGAVVAWGVGQYEAEGPLAEAVCVEVPPGSSMRGLSENLADQGTIRSAQIYRIGASYADKNDQLKAGSFLVPENASMAEIVDIVTRGGQSTCGTEVVFRIGVTAQQVQVRELDPASSNHTEVAAFDPAVEEAPDAYLDVRNGSDTRYRIALAEGATSWQIVEALKAADFLKGEITEVPVEGSLAPDSYEVAAGDDRTEILQRMQDLQVARLEEAWRTRDEDLPIASPDEALILASIIEKETGIAEERGQVASVFVNRLRQGMRLQTDPTVIYGVTNGQAPLGRGLRRSELDRVTPYNTYVIEGLPPTPIANPGFEALQAAVKPETTPYLFFVADGTGGHAFAETLAEHNENVAKWRRIEAERANQ